MRLSRLLTIAALCLAPGALARAESGSTFGDTEPSLAVRQAIAAMKAGDLERFGNTLSEGARDLYGTPEGMRFLRERFERLSAGSVSIETRSDTQGVLKGDSFVLVSHRSYSVDVLGRRPGSLDPIWNVSVKCIGLSLVDSFGGTNKRCRISEISSNSRAREPGSAAAPGVRDLRDKNLEDPLAGPQVPGESVIVPAMSGSASTNRKPW